MKPRRVSPCPGQESVWDYPRPPRIEDVEKKIEVIFNGVVVASTRRAKRVLETSHPPNYYVPLADVNEDCLEAAEGVSICEWKGRARYLTVAVGGKRAEKSAWSYPDPTEPFAVIKDHIAFYAGRMDACRVDDEEVVPQPGGFYGGWITKDIVGPFKGDPGTILW